MLKNKLTEQMAMHAQSEYPLEACGLITKDFEYIPCKNRSPNPKTSFIIDPFAIVNHQGNIWGFFHSHPGSSDPLPSKEDIESTLFTEYNFIVGFNDKFYVYWWDKNIQDMKYEKLDESHFETS